MRLWFRRSEPAPAGTQTNRPAHRVRLSGPRVFLTALGFAAIYGLIILKLVKLGLDADDHTAALDMARTQVSAQRPDILDRNGEVLATDIKTSSLFAEPRHVLGVSETIDALATVLPDMRDPQIRQRLSTKAGFVWLKREITPMQRARIYRLGLPGVGFIDENKRLYPVANLTSHVLGLVNVDNQGISGIEKYLDDKLALTEMNKLGVVPPDGLMPQRLSIDLRIQHVVRDEVNEAKKRYRAVAGMGIVLDVKTGEVLAMVSLPDFDPAVPKEALDKDNMNRDTAGVFEMGSVFKTFNSAMALDSGRVSLSDSYETRGGLQIGHQHISEFHGKGRALTVPEIFIYSSNTGSARMALKAGLETQHAFFEKVGFFKKLDTELPEEALPMFPKRLSEISTATMSFGHGISVTPMHTAIAGAAMINGGLLMNPTFFPRTPEEAMKTAVRVIRPETSDKMRYLFRINCLPPGSGTRAEVEGYRVGGKTGTAEKVEAGRYEHDKRRNSFLAAFPMEDPQYLVLVVLDEPKPDKDGNSAVAGLNTAPLAGNIIRRIAPMLGVMPKFDMPPITAASN
ncbi:MAG: penicillin-binding protein 2 [Ancalomicrobiaceae bacterium]|nr:penicillin-binding protein 2 [Ancalomicrobiaceae bacterium]